MKLSEKTFAVLKNFATINSGVVLQKGDVQRSIHPQNSILVEAKIEDSFPQKFGIYDLNQFLGNVTTLDNPELTFESNSVIMNDGEIELRYNSCSPNLIVYPPEGKELTLKDPEVSFNISSASLQKILRVAAMNNLSNISVLSEKGDLIIRAHELKNDTSNYASIRVGEYQGSDFIMSFKTENFRLIPDDYFVEIKIDNFSSWTNKSKTLKYFIAKEIK